MIFLTSGGVTFEETQAKPSGSECEAKLKEPILQIIFPKCWAMAEGEFTETQYRTRKCWGGS